MAKVLQCDYCTGVICANLEQVKDGLRADNYTHIQVSAVVTVVKDDYGKEQRSSVIDTLDACSLQCARALLIKQATECTEALSKGRTVRNGSVKPIVEAKKA